MPDIKTGGLKLNLVFRFEIDWDKYKKGGKDKQLVFSFGNG